LEEKRVMPIKRYKPEQIVTMLRQIEVSIANGKTTPQACKEAEITMQTFYRWRKEYGGLKMDQAKRLKELEKENGKLKRLVAELSLDKQIFYSLKEAQILTERWRVEYNTERPHSALGYRPPAPQAILPKQPGHGDMENASRFPHPHTPDDGYGQMSNKALH
jgi:putative transposase